MITRILLTLAPHFAAVIHGPPPVLEDLLDVSLFVDKVGTSKHSLTGNDRVRGAENATVKIFRRLFVNSRCGRGRLIKMPVP